MPRRRYDQDEFDDEERFSVEERSLASRSYPNRNSLPQPSIPSIIDTASVKSLPPQIAAPRRATAETARHLTRRDLLAWGGAALATAAGLGWISQTKVAKSAIAAIAPHAPDTPTPVIGTPSIASTSKSPLGYFHAFFEVNTPDEVAAAAALGVNYTITYYEASWDSADVNTAMGKALLKHGMKTFVNLEYPYLHCANGYGQVDGLDQIRNLVLRFRDSPLTAGYWIKDDDCTNTGDESVALIGIYNLVRSLDPNPQHYIVPGFGDAGSIYRNFAYGCCDLIGFYPYPAYSRGPATETKEMLATVKARTPSGLTPPPFIGIYQAFASPSLGRPELPVSNIVDQVATYIADGAVGIGGFGWNAPNETLIAANDKTFRDAIGAVTQWLIDHGYGTPK